MRDKKTKGIGPLDWDTLASETTPCQVSEGQDESPPGLVLQGTTDWQMTTIGGHFTWSLTTFIGLLNQRLRYFDGATYIRRLWSVIQRWRNAEIQTYIIFPPNQWFPCVFFFNFADMLYYPFLTCVGFWCAIWLKQGGGGCNKI